jgi:hypothetical protein
MQTVCSIIDQLTDRQIPSYDENVDDLVLEKWTLRDFRIRRAISTVLNISATGEDFSVE